MKKYSIINDMDLNRFMEKVTTAINSGAKLVGGVSSQGAMLLQAVEQDNTAETKAETDADRGTAVTEESPRKKTATATQKKGK